MNSKQLGTILGMALVKKSNKASGPSKNKKSLKRINIHSCKDMNKKTKGT